MWLDLLRLHAAELMHGQALGGFGSLTLCALQRGQMVYS